MDGEAYWWDGFTPNTPYNFEVYVKTNDTQYPEEFWGSFEMPFISPDTTYSFTREMPYAVDIEYYNSNTLKPIPAGGDVPLGTFVKQRVTVRKNISDPQEVQVRVIIDKNESLLWDHEGHSPIRNITSSELIFGKWLPSFEATDLGKYKRSIVILTKNKEGDFVATDKWAFGPAFTVTPDTVPLTLTIKNVSGGNPDVPQEHGIVRVYDDNNEFSDLKRYTNSYGEAEWDNLRADTYYTFKVFVNSPETQGIENSEEFWGKLRKIGADITLTHTFVREMPYAVDIEYYNSES